MKINFNSFTGFILLMGWIMGTVMAFDIGVKNGICSIVFGPFYSWYLVVKYIMAFTGFYHGS